MSEKEGKGRPRRSKPNRGNNEPQELPENPLTPGDQDLTSAAQKIMADITSQTETVEGYNSNLLRISKEEASPLLEEIKPPDVWFAQPPDVAIETYELVSGIDDRVRVTRTNNFPWSCICALRIISADETLWSGTGWFVSPRTIITAGHCVYIHNHGGWVKSVEVIPGANGSQRPYPPRVSTVVRSVRGWTRHRSEFYDYGAIILPRGSSHELPEFFRHIDLDNPMLESATINICGYPGDKTSYTQWFHSRYIDSLTIRNIFYHIDTTRGQSGAPVWVLDNNRRYVVGIHTNGSYTGNSALRITKDVVKNINDWIQEGI